MAEDADKNPLEKAEGLLKRVLERLGAAVDSKLAPEDENSLSAEEARLGSLVEHTIESNLREDGERPAPLAPNRFKLLLTYEERARLGDRYVDALARQLKAVAGEFITNRRYRTLGPVEFEIGSDLFTKTTMIRASFGTGEHGQAPSGNAGQAAVARAIELRTTDGRTYRFELKAGGTPSYIGRAAGSTVRLDDPSVSRLHCSLALRANGEIVVSDLGSSNGTSTNGRIVNHNEARVVEPGDTIAVGDVKLVLIE